MNGDADDNNVDVDSDGDSNGNCLKEIKINPKEPNKRHSSVSCI